MIPRLRYPLPVRATIRTASGGWASRAWTEEDIFLALLGGGWFAPGTEFASRAAAAFATKMLTYLEY